MPHRDRPILLDVTRLVSRSWTGRRSTGIDRVCYAYLRHFRKDARAVVQYRGIVRVLDARRSEELFDLLLAPARGFRAKIGKWAPSALLFSGISDDFRGLNYINVSHTDFDLTPHTDWVTRNGLRSFYFIHDLIPIRHPNLSRPHAVARHTGRVRAALCHANTIIVGSEIVAEDLRAFASEEALPTPTIVVSNIAGERLRTDPTHPSPSGVVPTAPYFICVGTIEPRKNHQLLFDVWGRLASQLGDQTPRLMVIGQKGPMTRDILAQASASEHIKLLHSCSDAQLSALIRNSVGLLMPSLAEGFGLPVDEALAAGTSVIASDIPIFREIGQGIPTLIDPEDRAAWGRTIMAFTDVSIATETARTKRSLHYRAPTWDAHFDAVEHCLSLPVQQPPSSAATLKKSAACESSLAA
ncbi:glycosyltransferase family 4 protein [Erythrobacter sp. Alg231-14]|uniref:glycosyltransferase family 4 protein n=1 Tax=Erythrobacter sp. Alg231-14 TaxID=1922225 RepID=UPI00307C954C